MHDRLPWWEWKGNKFSLLNCSPRRIPLERGLKMNAHRMKSTQTNSNLILHLYVPEIRTNPSFNTTFLKLLWQKKASIPTVWTQVWNITLITPHGTRPCPSYSNSSRSVPRASLLHWCNVCLTNTFQEAQSPSLVSARTVTRIPRNAWSTC